MIRNGDDDFEWVNAWAAGARATPAGGGSAAAPAASRAPRRAPAASSGSLSTLERASLLARDLAEIAFVRQRFDAVLAGDMREIAMVRDTLSASAPSLVSRSPRAAAQPLSPTGRDAAEQSQPGATGRDRKLLIAGVALGFLTVIAMGVAVWISR